MSTTLEKLSPRGLLAEILAQAFSDHAAAMLLGVGANYIRRRRHQLEAAGVIPVIDIRLGTNGVAIDTARIGKHDHGRTRAKA